MRTLRKQTLQSTGAQSTLFPAASPASLSAQQVKEKERKTTASSGRRCCELYERCSRHGWWLKTLVGYLLNSEDWYSSACVLTWKVKGTKYNRLLFQLALSVRRTAGTEFGLLPTPTGMMPGDVDLDKREARMEKLKAKGLSPATVPLSVLALKGLLPTPTASCRNGGCVTGRETELNHFIYQKLNNSKRQGAPSLADLAVSKLLPTPQTVDGYKTTKASRQDNLNKTFQTGGTSQLNPLFVGEMMGFPADWLVSPFQSGEAKASRHLETP